MPISSDSPVDLDAERTVLATMWEANDPPAWLKPECFSSATCGLVFEVLVEIKKHGLEITTERVIKCLERFGAVGAQLKEELNRIEFTPATIPLGPLAMRLVELFWRRRALERLARASALLQLPESHGGLDLVDRELDAAKALMRGREIPS